MQSKHSGVLEGVMKRSFKIKVVQSESMQKNK